MPILILSMLLFASSDNSSDLKPRKSFRIPLLKLSLKNDKNKPGMFFIRIYSNDMESYASIGRYSDKMNKSTRSGIYVTTYSEPSVSAHMLSNFEEKKLGEVLKSLKSTLKILLVLLEKNEFAKARYLDAYLPKFMKNFYFLNDMLFNMESPLPEECNVNEYLFDSSENSPKTDARINKWQSEKEHVIKLRIAIKELMYNIDRWKKDAPKDFDTKDKITGLSTSFKNSYSLFVKLYFY